MIDIKISKAGTANTSAFELDQSALQITEIEKKVEKI